jgi:cold shock CspA family protein
VQRNGRARRDFGRGHDFQQHKGTRMSEVFEGEIKMWRAERGFGFARYSEGDIFVHVRDIAGRGYAVLTVGQRVRFSIGRSEFNSRTCAKNVEVLAPIISPMREEFARQRDDEGEPKPISDMSFMR